ncbi:MAG TPA: L-seryl-tRNA(Sec) selenium transferase [Gemmatimonadaceae bacterium]|nr:L-seryl-tRNA(Sec) selenium transferase [Gemmatimonadaceae bacterium]
MSDHRRAIPSVGALLESEAMRPLLDRAPRPLVTDALRELLAAAREAPDDFPASLAEWADRVGSLVEARRQPSLRPVLNATGVVLHTNLGRASLPRPALAAVHDTASGYSTLEYDLLRGERGSRSVHCASLLVELTGAEDALVVNNGAAALLLALDTFARGRDAVISRGELIEIGGSFRVPDIMASSGARLREVGTTNRTHLEDYRGAVTPTTGAIVKVHRSNFAMRGFVAEVDARTLARLSKEGGVPLVHDLGSGLFISLDAIGLSGEPVAADAVRDGATVITMSGDKLLGGPQAGIVLGSREAVARMRANPLARALRVDKMTLAALEATLDLYREPARAMREIPALAMLATSVATLGARADAMVEYLSSAGVQARRVHTEAQVGGGAFPDQSIASVGVELAGDAEGIAASLRAGDPPVVGRKRDGVLLLDLRTVPETEDERLARAVLAAMR